LLGFLQGPIFLSLQLTSLLLISMV
jgi:hypothetical protein